MKNYAIIENGKVINVVVADEEYAQSQGWILCESGGIDWDYVNGQFVDNRPMLEPTTQAKPEPTKEELLAQLAVLSAKINALGA
jgi:hypothetical protein